MKVLIVEDNPKDRKLLRFVLETHNCEVIEAENGQIGLELAAAHMPELIVSDAMMPVMDGFRFLRNIKNDERLRAIPFVFYSAVYTGLKDERLALSIGADMFITKPKDPQGLWDELQTALEDHKAGNKEVRSGQVLEDEEYLRDYTQVVASKLEEKIRELEEAKERIEKSEKRYKNIFESTLDGIYQTDSGGFFTLMNQAGAKIFGFKSASELIGRPAVEFWAEAREREAFVAELRRSKSIKSFPIRARRRDGTIVYVESSSHIIEDEEGNFIGIEGILRDVTERKSMETELRQRIEELEKFYEMAVNREIRMKELKEEMERLKDRLSKCNDGTRHE